MLPNSGDAFHGTLADVPAIGEALQEALDWSDYEMTAVESEPNYGTGFFGFLRRVFRRPAYWDVTYRFVKKG